MILIDNEWMKYPKKEERKDIIMKEHSLGHFGTVATTERVKRNYFWKKMMQDIDLRIKRCLTCQRNKGMNRLDHMAKATKIDYIFQRICMDLVSGLPITENGNKIILVIVEFMSKHVSIYPMKSKSSEEVADHLWKWISLYGPPTTILSDQGKEFVNKTITALLDKTGIERRVTSPYNPNTNGQCERMNQTVIKVLRKHTETNQRDWDKWISFVEFTYNTRKNPTTGFSPYEILYGVKINEFIDYQHSEINQEEVIIAERAIQLKNLIENDRPTVLEKIRKAQEIQKSIQNRRGKPTEEEIPIGTRVMVKNDGIVKATLENSYQGLYIVTGRASGGNYRLKTADGQEVKQTWPITKLKPIHNDPDKPERSLEVEKILDKMRDDETDQMMYLVKWKGLDETENQWILEENFDSMDIIEKYNRQLAEELEKTPNETLSTDERKKRGRPRKQNKDTQDKNEASTSEKNQNKEKPEETKQSEPEHIYSTRGRKRRVNIGLAMTIIHLLMLITGIFAKDNTTKPKRKQGFGDRDASQGFYNLTDKFIVCEKLKFRAINIDDINTSCKTYTNQNNMRLQEFFRGSNINIIKKINRIMETDGYVCIFYKTKAELEETFTAYRYPPRLFIEEINTSAEECKQFVKEGLCGDRTKICEDEDECHTQARDFKEQYE